MSSPHDLLPIVKPLEDKTEYSPTYFYENVVSKLVLDIIKMKLTGIPINISKVKDVEKTLDEVLENTKTKLSNSNLISNFLANLYSKSVEEAKSNLKYKSNEDFAVEFNISNKTHRSYAINEYLESIDRSDMKLPEWTKKDLTKANQILSSNFIKDIIASTIKPYMKDIIDKAMNRLAEDKANSFNKSLINKFNNNIIKYNKEFNPGSSAQKSQFFESLGVESENTTPKGQAKWDRKELERLEKLLKSLIEEKENGSV